jgi:HK97 family phage major capsid protein
VEEMDYVIMHGTGVGQPTGILNDPRLLANVAQGKNVITMTAADINDWTKWRKKLFAHIPLGSRNQQMEFIFPVSTVESYLLTMADANNNPIFRQAADLSEDGSRFFGRQVSFVEPNIIPDFDTANQGDVIGIYWKPTDYAINTQLSFGMKRYYDEEKNEWVNKAITILDGKMLSLNNIWLIKKG